MIEFLKRLLWDESAFERWARACLLTLAGLVMSGQAEWLPAYMVAPILGLAGLIGAGEKNIEPNK